MDEVIKGVLVFFAVAIVDVFWTLYIQYVHVEYEDHAGLMSAVIILFGAYYQRAYVHDGWLAFPAALGAYVGTKMTIRYKKYRRLNATPQRNLHGGSGDGSSV